MQIKVVYFGVLVVGVAVCVVSLYEVASQQRTSSVCSFLFFFFGSPPQVKRNPSRTNVIDNIFFCPLTLLWEWGFNTLTTVTSGIHPEKNRNKKHVSMKPPKTKIVWIV